MKNSNLIQESKLELINQVIDSLHQPDTLKIIETFNEISKKDLSNLIEEHENCFQSTILYKNLYKVIGVSYVLKSPNTGIEYTRLHTIKNVIYQTSNFLKNAVNTETQDPLIESLNKITNAKITINSEKEEIQNWQNEILENSKKGYYGTKIKSEASNLELPTVYV